MNASFEVTSGVLRIHPYGDGFGGAFDFAAAVAGDEGVATIKGLTGPIRPRHVRPIAAALKGAGFHTARWVRHRASGEHHEEVVNLNRVVTA